MGMDKLKQRLFESDRHMELKLRLAAKKVGLGNGEAAMAGFAFMELPERKLLRLIERVRRL